MSGGQNLTGLTVFLKSVDPMNKEQEDSRKIDSTASRLAFYKAESVEKHQNTVYCVDSVLLTEKDSVSSRSKRNDLLRHAPSLCCFENNRDLAGGGKNSQQFKEPKSNGWIGEICWEATCFSVVCNADHFRTFHRRVFLVDLQQEKAYNPFSEIAKMMISEMGNVEMFKELSVAFVDSSWKKSECTQHFHQSRLDAFSIQNHVVTKGRPRVRQGLIDNNLLSDPTWIAVDVPVRWKKYRTCSVVMWKNVIVQRFLRVKIDLCFWGDCCAKWHLNDACWCRVPHGAVWHIWPSWNLEKMYQFPVNVFLPIGAFHKVDVCSQFSKMLVVTMTTKSILFLGGLSTLWILHWLMITLSKSVSWPVSRWISPNLMIRDMDVPVPNVFGRRFARAWLGPGGRWHHHGMCTFWPWIPWRSLFWMAVVGPRRPESLWVLLAIATNCF